MNWHVDWFGEFHGDWFGPVEQVPGAIYGAATIEVSASGSATGGAGFISSAASLSVSAAGDLQNGSNVTLLAGGKRRPRVHLPVYAPTPRPRVDEDEEVALLVALR